MKNSKTDAVDAATLAEYAARMETRPTDETLALRSFARRINALTGESRRQKSPACANRLAGNPESRTERCLARNWRNVSID